MPISDYNKDFIPRMADPRDLTLEEICGMVPWLSHTPVGIDGMLNMRLAFQQMKALLELQNSIKKFDESSSRLTTKIYLLTLLLTVVGLLQLCVVLLPLFHK